MQHSRPPWTSAILLALAALALGQALQVNNGFFHGRAMLWLALALAITVAACLSTRRPLAAATAPILRLVLLAGILFQLAQLLSAPPLLYSTLRHGRDDVVLAISLGTTGLLALAVAFGGASLPRWAFAGIVAAHVAAGARTIHLVPEPQIDVVTVHEAAFGALANGDSPYGVTFKNIYGSRSRFYGEGMASDSEVRFGFPYPPLALAFTAPAQWLLGDYRYALVGSLATVAVLLASFGWSRHAMLSATLLLTTPRVLFELEQGWTEPSVLLMLVLLVVGLRRFPAATGTLVGLGMSVKQYLAAVLFLLPLMRLSGAREARRTIVVSLATAAVVVVPFAIWDWDGFMRSVVMLQLREPFRLDSLSFLVWLARRGWQPPTIVTTVTAAALATLFVRRTLPRSPAGFAAAMAMVSLAGFAFGKKAFCNYYFFVIGAMMTAVAATQATDRAIETNVPESAEARRG